MFNSNHQLLQHLATNIVKSIDEPSWKSAYIEVCISDKASRSTIATGGYFISDDTTDHDFQIGPEFDLIETSFRLYELSKKTPNDNPFNKYKFTLNNDGTFDIEFKYDEDFAYMKSLDADSDEFDEFLELDVTDQIESWEGLPEDHPRPWVSN